MMAPIMMATIKTPLKIAGETKKRKYLCLHRRRVAVCLRITKADTVRIESLGTYNTCVSVSYS